jgi:hypothetical protein
MAFCLGEGKYKSEGEGYKKNYCLFNQQLEKEEWKKENKKLPIIKLKLAEYNDGETTRSYKEAWEFWWDNADAEDKDAILNCKYFDQKIFKGITGINIKKKQKKQKKVEISIDEIAKKFDVPVKNLKKMPEKWQEIVTALEKSVAERCVEEAIKFIRSGSVAGSFSEGCDCNKCRIFEKGVKKDLLREIRERLRRRGNQKRI